VGSTLSVARTSADPAQHPPYPRGGRAWTRRIPRSHLARVAGRLPLGCKDRALRRCHRLSGRYSVLEGGAAGGDSRGALPDGPRPHATVPAASSTVTKKPKKAAVLLWCTIAQKKFRLYLARHQGGAYPLPSPHSVLWGPASALATRLGPETSPAAHPPVGNACGTWRDPAAP
jgi:hypothetical protein